MTLVMHVDSVSSSPHNESHIFIVVIHPQPVLIFNRAIKYCVFYLDST